MVYKARPQAVKPASLVHGFETACARLGGHESLSRAPKCLVMALPQLTNSVVAVQF